MSAPNTFDPTEVDVEADAEEQRQEAVGKAQEIADFIGVASTVEGRRFLWRLLSETGLYRSSFTGDATVNFLEGKRAIGLWLMQQIHEHWPDVYVTMLKEHNVNDN